MTVEDFYMKFRPYVYATVVEITAVEGSMKSELEVGLQDFEDALGDMADYLFDWIKKQIEPRARNAEDEGDISPGELAAFLKTLEVIEW